MRHPHAHEGRLAGRGGSRGREADPPSTEGLAGWFAGRLPDDWFEGPPEVVVDRDEVLVVGRIAAPLPAGDDAAGSGAGPATTEGTTAATGPATTEGTTAATAEAEAGRLSRFREDTREARMRIAREAEHRYGRKVAWGAQAGGTRQVFTSLSVPVMTRLRQDERIVLDTLVDSGVARSRSEALAWCVRLVGRNADAWLAELREAMTAVERVRATGPDAQ